jgi:hypothetical protein
MEDEQRDTDDEGQPNGEPGPSNPDESVPSEQDADEDLPGIPDDEHPADD